MTPATKSALHVKTKKSRSFLSICRTIVVKTLTGSFAAMTVSLATLAALVMGVGWLLAVSLEARAELQSVVVVDAPRSVRLARSGLFPEGMPSMSALAVGLSPFPETPAERPAPASVVALAFAAIDSSNMADYPNVVRVATSSIAYAAKPAVFSAAKPPVYHVASTGSIATRAVIDSATPSPVSRMRIRWAALRPTEDLDKKPEFDRRMAVYDITARTVYLPSGERLEAHSGYGRYMDDPRHVKLKNRGPTPPNIYKLTKRESLFHGVQALRMTPEDEDAMYGRDGILTHSYLLGSSGQSHGCVSFKDYPRFLRAFQRGEFDRMQVVTRLDKPPTFVASPAVPNKTAGAL